MAVQAFSALSPCGVQHIDFKCAKCCPPLHPQEFSRPARHLPVQWLVEKVLLRVRFVSLRLQILNFGRSRVP